MTPFRNDGYNRYGFRHYWTMIIDLDVHTSQGSGDSNLSPQQLVEEALEHPIFDLVDAIEVANGSNTDEGNAFAREVARHLGKPMVSGSDAHSVNGLGKCVTVFPEPVSSLEEFLRALHAGHFYPATALLNRQTTTLQQWRGLDL